MALVVDPPKRNPKCVFFSRFPLSSVLKPTKASSLERKTVETSSSSDFSSDNVEVLEGEVHVGVSLLRRPPLSISADSLLLAQCGAVTSPRSSNACFHFSFYWLEFFDRPPSAPTPRFTAASVTPLFFIYICVVLFFYLFIRLNHHPTHQHRLPSEGKNPHKSTTATKINPASVEHARNEKEILYKWEKRGSVGSRRNAREQQLVSDLF